MSAVALSSTLRRLGVRGHFALPHANALFLSTDNSATKSTERSTKSELFSGAFRGVGRPWSLFMTWARPNFVKLLPNTVGYLNNTQVRKRSVRSEVLTELR